MGKFGIHTVAHDSPFPFEALLVLCIPVEGPLSCVCSVWLFHCSLRGCIRDLIDKPALNSSLLNALSRDGFSVGDAAKRCKGPWGAAESV